MLTLFLLAAAALLFLFGLWKPESGQWMKWAVGTVGVAGTLLVLFFVWAVWATGHLLVIDGQVIQFWELSLMAFILVFQFWMPALGLWLGRKVGRIGRAIMRGVENSIQTANH